MISILLKWLVVLLAALNFGYMLFDGSRALIKGDYIRPSSGEYAGQLGPWTKLVSAIGIKPESSLMKILFILWGLAGLIFTICYASNLAWAPRALLVMNVLSLWYLWMGTVSGGLQVVLLILRKVLT